MLILIITPEMETGVIANAGERRYREMCGVTKFLKLGYDNDKICRLLAKTDSEIKSIIDDLYFYGLIEETLNNETIGVELRGFEYPQPIKLSAHHVDYLKERFQKIPKDQQIAADSSLTPQTSPLTTPPAPQPSPLTTPPAPQTSPLTTPPAPQTSSLTTHPSSLTTQAAPKPWSSDSWSPVEDMKAGIKKLNTEGDRE